MQTNILSLLGEVKRYTCSKIFHTFTSFSAPRGLTFTGQSINIFNVKVTPGVITGLHHYYIAVKDDPSLFCNAMGSSCAIRGLTSAKKYTVQARACLSAANSGACGQPAEGSTWTIPTGQRKRFLTQR